jgi:hypothetical protein
MPTEIILSQNIMETWAVCVEVVNQQFDPHLNV